MENSVFQGENLSGISAFFMKQLPDFCRKRKKEYFDFPPGGEEIAGVNFCYFREKNLSSGERKEKKTAAAFPELRQF